MVSVYGWLKWEGCRCLLCVLGDRRELAALVGNGTMLSCAGARVGQGEKGRDRDKCLVPCPEVLRLSDEKQRQSTVAVSVTGVGAQGILCLQEQSSIQLVSSSVRQSSSPSQGPVLWLSLLCLVPLLCPHPCPSYGEIMVATSQSPGRDRPVPLHISITQTATGLRASNATGTPQGLHDATGIQ